MGGRIMFLRMGVSFSEMCWGMKLIKGRVYASER
jgi:hypothetical protein